MTVSERIPFSGLLLPLQEGHTYSCDRCTTDGMELLFVFRENGHSRYYFESDMQGFDRKAASDSHILTVYPQPNGDGEVSLLHLKRAATDRFFPLSPDQALRHADRRDVSVGGRTPSAPVCRCFLTSWMKSEY